MPDWISHLIIGLIVAELFNVRKKSLILLGTLMPDLISKLSFAFFYFGIIDIVSLDSFHTPVVDFLLAILIAPLFRYPRLKTIFLISIGLLTHFLSDMTMRHFTSGMRLLFPFYMGVYRLDWIWPEQSVYFLIISLSIYIFIKIIKKIDFYKLRA